MSDEMQPNETKQPDFGPNRLESIIYRRNVYEPKQIKMQEEQRERERESEGKEDSNCISFSLALCFVFVRREFTIKYVRYVDDDDRISSGSRCFSNFIQKFLPLPKYSKNVGVYFRLERDQTTTQKKEKKQNSKENSMLHILFIGDGDG